MILTGKTEVLGDKLILVPLCPSQILQGLPLIVRASTVNVAYDGLNQGPT